MNTIALLLLYILIMLNLSKPNLYHYLPLLIGVFFIGMGVIGLRTASFAEPYSVFRITGLFCLGAGELLRFFEDTLAKQWAFWNRLAKVALAIGFTLLLTSYGMRMWQ